MIGFAISNNLKMCCYLNHLICTLNIKFLKYNTMGFSFVSSHLNLRLKHFIFNLCNLILFLCPYQVLCEYFCSKKLFLLVSGGSAPQADRVQHLRDYVPAGAQDLLPLPGLVQPLHPRLWLGVLHPPPHRQARG